MNMEYKELLERIKDLNNEDAISEIYKALEQQGKRRDKEIEFLYAELLLESAKTKNPKDIYEAEDSLYELIGHVRSLLKKNNPHYNELLCMAAYGFSAMRWPDEDAVRYGEEYYELHKNDPEAPLLLGRIYFNNGNYDKALELIDIYLKNGDPMKGLKAKIDICIRAKKFEEAFELINYCANTFRAEQEIWDNYLIYYYEENGEKDKAVLLIEKQLESVSDKTLRSNLFHRAYLNVRGEDDENTLKHIREYIKKYPDDFFAYSTLARLISDDNERIMLCEKAHELCDSSQNVSLLLNSYMQRAADGDIVKYFDLIDKVIDNNDVDEYILRSYAKTIIYGKFYSYDRGQSIKLLEKKMLTSENECDFTLIGKAYEHGVGTAVNTEKAFECYQKAYLGFKDKQSCHCGLLFYSYALYFGIGTNQDKEKAKDIIVELMKVRGGWWDYDQNCLYAVAAFEGDPRFNVRKALRLLARHKLNASSLLLMYNYSKTKQAKQKYLTQFLQIAQSKDALENDYFKKYIDNPDLPYVPFIHN